MRKTMHGKRGYFIILVLVFGAIFLSLIISLTGFMFVQQRSQLSKENRERALQIAEAGLDYYKWFLSHFPNDTTDGTGESGPYVHTYDDPEGGTIGSFSLEVNGNEQCGTVSSIDIVSTGWSDVDSSYQRIVSGRYARPSVAEYAYILNSNVWAGSDRVIVGPYHSNGGIRMDGTNNSTVTSAVVEWSCTSSFGCSPTQMVDGVFGDGSENNLWEFPVPPVDFVGLTIDLVAMKASAETNGLYFPPAGRGYHFVFNSDETISVYQVDNVDSVWGYSQDEGWHFDSHIISSETFLGSYLPPPDCQLVFVEDDLWIEGIVGGKVTIASADVTNPNVDTSVILEGDITYTVPDGSVGLTTIGEKDVLIPLLSPTDMELRGIFIAQKGHFGRNHYTTEGSHDVPSQYNSYVQQNTLTMTGTIVSNGRVGTKWTSGGSFVSGYANRENYYDRNLATEPPPLTPYVSNEYTFIEWREEQ